MSACQRARLRATAVRACSSANRVFIEAQALAPEKAPDGVPAHRDFRCSQPIPKPVDRQMRRLADQRMNELPVLLQAPGQGR